MTDQLSAIHSVMSEQATTVIGAVVGYVVVRLLNEIRGRVNVTTKARWVEILRDIAFDAVAYAAEVSAAHLKQTKGDVLSPAAKLGLAVDHVLSVAGEQGISVTKESAAQIVTAAVAQVDGEGAAKVDELRRAGGG